MRVREIPPGICSRTYTNFAAVKISLHEQRLLTRRKTEGIMASKLFVLMLVVCLGIAKAGKTKD